MTGLGFNPTGTDGHFAGLVFVSSLQHSYYDALLIFIRRYAQQIMKANEDRNITMDNWLSALGRTYNGHTALMVGKDRRIEAIVGWDPKSAAKAFIESTRKGYARMQPLEGEWHNDKGMDGDPSAVFFGTRIDAEQYADFKEFISGLVGRDDFGPHLADSGIDFRYAFAPADWMKLTSSLENNARSFDDINIVANCADAAFHVLSSFLYDWKKPGLVAELKAFVDEENRSNKNFSQGKLMRWVKDAMPQARL